MLSVSAITPRARLSRTKSANACILGSAVSSSLRRHSQQQARAFGFGWWTTDLDREQLREARRRSRAALRCRRIESLNRKLSWDQQPHPREYPRPFIRGGGQHWQSKRCFAYDRNGARGTSAFSGTNRGERPGQNIEDVERGAWGHFLFGDQQGSQSSWTSPIDGLRSYVSRGQDRILDEFGLGASSKASMLAFKRAEESYVIDPITNRKVYKSLRRHTSGDSVDDFTAKTACNPVVPPTASELRIYGKVDFDAAESQQRPALRSEGQSRKNRPGPSAVLDPSDANFGKLSQRPLEKTRQYSDLDKYDDLHKYRPVAYNEPDGRLLDNELKESTVETEELLEYKPVEHNEPDGKAINEDYGDPTVDAGELAKYKPFKYNEPDGKISFSSDETPSYDPAELEQYQPFKWNEPHGQPETPAELGHEGYAQEEVQKYQAFRWNEPNGKPDTPVDPSYEVNDPSEAVQYKAVRDSEPDDRPGQSSISVAEENSPGKTPDEVYSNVLRKIQSLSLEAEEAALERSRIVSATSPASQRHKKNNSQESRAKLESAMARMNSEADAIDEMAILSIKPAKKRAATGWNRLSESQQKQVLADPYSLKPCGLETSYAEECQGKPTWPTYVKIHKRTETASTDAIPLASSPMTTKTSTLYKVLAYDEATQTINTAETSSTVHDAKTPLTPAEALLRLSHPTKFFPHLRTLEAQGFEVVEGRGDVLVFRKVRIQDPASTEDAAPMEKASASSRVNPIDMTGAAQYVLPSTANFASPTGYVNLDLPSLDPNPSSSNATPATDLPPPPKFRSNIDVRRVEDVFSGPQENMANEMSSAKPGLAKRMLVGATWVAGVSYVLGVIGEQIKGN